jgi:hypothetical protein
MKTEFKKGSVFRWVSLLAMAALALGSQANAVVTLAPVGTPLNQPHNYSWNRMTTINVYSGEVVPFVAYQINTFGKSGGNYTFTMNTVGFAGAINLYQNNFDPTIPNANFWANGVVANSAGTISQTLNIPANSLFEVVFSAKTTGSAGTFSATVSGPSDVNVTTTTNVQIRVGPKNQTIAAGDFAYLRVYAIGPLAHKWQWYGGSSGNTNVLISNATNASFYPGPLNNSTSYWVKVTGPVGAGSVNSGTANVTVTGNPGANYAGSLNAGGCQLQNGNLFAVQRFEIQQAGNYTFTITPGFTLTTYQGVFDAVHPQNNLWGVLNGYYAAGTYDLVISKSGSGAFAGAIGSGPAIVNLLSPLPPMFLSSPQDTTVTTGQAATLKVSTTCGTPFTLQWYRGESGDTSNPMAGGTGFNFTTPNLFTTTRYWVRMTYAGGSVDSGAGTVYLASGPITASGTITECDRRFPAEPGQPNNNPFYKTFVFTVATDGNYTFAVNGGSVSLYQAIFSPENPALNLYAVGAGTHNLLSGPNKYYLVISSATPGPYSVTVTAGPALVTLTPAPEITTPPANKNVFLNQTTTLNVVSPTAGVNYQWYVGSDCGNKFPISGANSNSFTTPAVTDYTNYCVELTTPGGSIFSPMVMVGVMPQALNDSASIDEDTMTVVPPVGILINDKKAVSRTLKVVNVQFPPHGSVTVTTNGGYTYFPNWNYNGPDNFKYQVTDGTLTSAVATVTINIASVNDAPMPGWDYRTTPFNTSLVLSTANLMSNDGDPDGDPLTFESVSPTSNLGATVTLNNGTVTYTPVNIFGNDNFEYTIKDSNGASSTGIVWVQIPLQDLVKLRISSLTGTNCHLQLLGHKDHGYWIKHAPTPTGPWELLGGVVTDPYGLAEIDDSASPQPATRFYRAVDMDVE